VIAAAVCSGQAPSDHGSDESSWSGFSTRARMWRWTRDSPGNSRGAVDNYGARYLGC